MNAGVLLTEFNPASPAVDRTKIIGATSGGCTFTATPTFVDFGDDIDNVPANTMELKVLQSVEVKMSGTFKTVDTLLAKQLMGAANVLADGKITPRLDLREADFKDIWWVGDYSDQNEGNKAGFMAIKLINALATGGFQVKSNDDGKGEFSFEYTGHYSINDISKVPYELYIQVGDATVTADSSLSALSIGSLTLTPTFDKDVLEYTTTTTNDSDIVTATATSQDATVAVIANKRSINTGNGVPWVDGANQVLVEVNNGDSSTTYEITVTKGA
jgi:hypothetical protein